MPNPTTHTTDHVNKAMCEHCKKELIPAPAKLRADGEQTYCGYLLCACNKRIMTDYGVVYPGTEEHELLLKSRKYSINDILG